MTRHHRHAFTAWLVVLVVSLVVAGVVVGRASAETIPPPVGLPIIVGEIPPPVVHVGPPATWPNVSCSRVTLRDEVRWRVFVLELCHYTRPVVLPGVWPPILGPCTIARPCPVWS